MSVCDMPWLQPSDGRCGSGVDDIVGNDIVLVRAVRGTTEVYATHGKDQTAHCLGVFRTTSVTLPSWSLIDEWIGPALGAPSCGGKLLLRTNNSDLAYDPDDTEFRFAGHKVWTMAGTLNGLFLAAHDGSRNPGTGDRLWKDVVDLKTCFGFPSAGAAQGVTAIRVANVGGKKRVFALVNGLGSHPLFLLWCDASNGIQDCTTSSPQNWHCLWQQSSTPLGTCPGLVCPGFTDWNPLPNLVTWERPVVLPTLGPNDTNEILFTTRRKYARDEFLRLYNDGTDWKEEHILDPVSCEPAGPELFTPLQVIEVSPTKLILTSPRHVFQSTNGGSSWQPLQSNYFRSAFYDVGPRFAQAPSDPRILYVKEPRAVLRTTGADQATVTFLQMDKTLAEHNPNPGVDGCKPGSDLDSCTGGVQGSPLLHNGRCGRERVMCGTFSEFIVDQTDSDRLYAATEQGLWTWKYPFTGTVNYPTIAPSCLTKEAWALSGEAWTPLQACPPASGPCLDSTYFLSIAQHTSDLSRFFAGSRSALYRSDDAGATWTAIPGITTPVNKILVLRPPGDDLVFAATDAGVYRSIDGGLTFAATAMNRPARDVTAHVSGGVVTAYAAGMDWDESTYLEGVYQSTDAGAPAAAWDKVVVARDNQRVMSVFVKSNGDPFVGLLGAGLRKLDPGPPIACGRISSQARTGSAPNYYYGHALTGVGDMPDLTSDCEAEWATLEFQPSPIQARVRPFDKAGNARGAILINTGVALAQPAGSLLGVGSVVPADPCPEVAVGLPVPASGTARVQIHDLCTPPTLIQELLPLPPVQYFGWSLARGGNHLAVGAPSDVSPSVFVYRLDNLAAAPQQLVAPFGAKRFGWSLAFGDMDGDGLQDLAVGAPDVAPFPLTPTGQGRVVLYRGTPTGFVLQRTILGPPAPPATAFGFSVTSGYDRRRTGASTPDGLADLVIGSPAGLGEVRWFGSPFDVTDNGISIPGDNVGDGFGSTVVLTRDVTGDLVPDLLVGAPTYDLPGLSDAGRVYIYESGAPASCVELEGNLANGRFGASLAEAGDADGNRTADVLVGQPDNATGVSGTAYLKAILR